MTEYGTMVSNQLIRHKEKHEGDKPIVYADIPTYEYVCTYAWEERADGIYQKWTVTDEPIEPPYPSDDITPDEALSLITGGTI